VGKSGRIWCRIIATVLVAAAGCATRPGLDNPLLVRPAADAVDNPIYVPLAYDTVFQRTLDVVDDYFEISYANRYDGRIETFPRIAPGLEQPWKPGNPNLDGRLLATLQTIRHRAFLLIQPADHGGFFVQVTVFRELEDLPRPTRSTAGDASFRSDFSLERQYEVIDPAVYESNWIPLGRDVPVEQAILCKLRECM
jgi:hypothetical protein